jgi:hypothetical protein
MVIKANIRVRHDLLSNCHNCSINRFNLKRMNKEKLIEEIKKLQTKYDKCTTRNVYKIGKQLREKQNELANQQS